MKRLKEVGEGVVMSKSDWCKLGVECGYLRKGRGVGGVRSRVSKVSKVSKGGGGGGVKRARSAYALFTKSKLSDEEEKMKSEGMKFMAIRSVTWNKMDEEARRPYVEESEKEKELLKKGMGIEEEEEVVVKKEVKKEVKKKKRGRPKKEEENEELTPRDRAAIISEASMDDEIALSDGEIEIDFGSDVEEAKEMVGYHEYNGVRYELSEYDELIDPKTKRPVGSLEKDGEVIMFE